jgi:hypothetical protein
MDLQAELTPAQVDEMRAWAQRQFRA